jgi:hypothetical protein
VLNKRKSPIKLTCKKHQLTPKKHKTKTKALSSDFKLIDINSYDQNRKENLNVPSECFLFSSSSLLLEIASERKRKKEKHKLVKKNCYQTPLIL